jgi:hypothetical protein
VDTRPQALNLLGLRSGSTEPNRFDDELFAFWRNEKGRWEVKMYPCTTDPGTFWLQNPGHPQGTAILKQGYYPNSWQIGLHRGQYPALVQRRPVTVLRQYRREDLLDFFNGTPDTGVFGINIHRASRSGTTLKVDRYSAGCQVLANADDFRELMQLAEIHRDRYGNSFSYALVDFRALRRETLRNILRGSIALTGIALLVWVLIREAKQKRKPPKVQKPRQRKRLPKNSKLRKPLAQ